MILRYSVLMVWSLSIRKLGFSVSYYIQWATISLRRYVPLPIYFCLGKVTNFSYSSCFKLGFCISRRQRIYLGLTNTKNSNKINSRIGKFTRFVQSRRNAKRLTIKKINNTSQYQRYHVFLFVWSVRIFTYEWRPTEGLWASRVLKGKKFNVKIADKFVTEQWIGY